MLLQAINVKNGHEAFNAEWLSRAVDLYLDAPFSVDTVLAQVSYALKDKTHNHVARSVLSGLSKRLRERNLSNEETTALRKGLAPHVVSSITEKGSFESELTMLGATVAVPEPTSIAIFGVGFASLIALRRRRRKA